MGRPQWTTTTAWPTIGLHFTTISRRLIQTNIQLAGKRTNKHTLSHTNLKIYNLSYKHTIFLYQITYITLTEIYNLSVLQHGTSARDLQRCWPWQQALPRWEWRSQQSWEWSLIMMMIMIIIKQSLPSSRQVQFATRLTAWSVAQVQLRPAQGGVGQNITWNIVLLEYYCTGILQKKLNWISHRHTGGDVRDLSQCGSWLPSPYWLLKHKQNRICCELSKSK